MHELSIFVDESGDFGEYSSNSPYYLVTFVIHEQNNSITQQIDRLNECINNIGQNIKAVHAAPIIRREEIYKNFDI